MIPLTFLVVKVVAGGVVWEGASRMLGFVNEESGKEAKGRKRAAERSKDRGDFEHLSDESKLAMLDEEADKIDRGDLGVKDDTPEGKAFYRSAARGNKAKTKAVEKSRDFRLGDKKPRL